MSQSRDDIITKTCAGGASKNCGDVVVLAQDAGNKVIFGKDGKAYVYPKGASEVRPLPSIGEGSFHQEASRSLLDSLQIEGGNGVANVVLGLGSKALNMLRNGVADATKSVSSSNLINSERAAGLSAGFDGSVVLMPYATDLPHIRQTYDWSCIAASCRMKLAEFGRDVPEMYSRQDLGLDETGGFISKIPKVFAEEDYSQIASKFSNNIRLKELQSAVDSGGPAIVTVRGHAVIADAIKDGKVYIRDPYVSNPYSVDLWEFARAWNKSGRQTITFEGK